MKFRELTRIFCNYKLINVLLMAEQHQARREFYFFHCKRESVDGRALKATNGDETNKTLVTQYL